MLAEPADQVIPGTNKRPAPETANEPDKKVKAGKLLIWWLVLRWIGWVRDRVADVGWVWSRLSQARTASSSSCLVSQNC